MNMKRRTFVGLLLTLSGLPFLPKSVARPVAKAVTDRIPVGTIMPYCGKTIPDSWLFCDGRVIYPHEHPELYQLVGNKLPNCQAIPSHSHSIVDPGHSHSIPQYIIRC